MTLVRSISVVLFSLFSIAGMAQTVSRYPQLKYHADNCESAYHLGDISMLSLSLSQYRKSMDSIKWESEADRLDQKALMFKFMSDLAYLRTEYVNSVALIDSAINYSQFFKGDNRLALYVEKAQSLFMVRDYGEASKLLEYAVNSGSDSFYSTYASAYALSLAYNGRFKKSLECMDDCMQDCYTKYLNKKQVEELYRRRAKILVLKAESANDDYNEAVGLYTSYFQRRKAEISSEFSSMTSNQREGFWLTQRQFIVDCYRLEDHAPELIYDVALFNKNLLLQFSVNHSQFSDCGWKDVRNGLPEDGAAIEFLQYRRDSSIYMSAVIVTKKCQRPVFVRIGAVDDILGHFIPIGMTVRQAIADESRDAKNGLYSDVALKQILWNDKIRSVISGCRDIYFSADGFFHQLAVEYLFPDNEVIFHRLTSTRTLCRKFSPISLDDARALICGDIDFSSKVPKHRNDANDALAFDNLRGRGVYLRNLTGSRIEIDSVKKIRSECNDTLLCGAMALEQSFRKLAPDYDILHISSHGCYSGSLDCPNDELKPNLTDSTLSKSMIFMSGADSNIHDSSFSPIGYDDGLLSARELSELDLGSVRLCVLAACQTGLGNVTADGVYGIQRGLKNSGAGAMILSLWNISDKATCVMMTNLYRHLDHREDVHSAFRHCREDMDKGSRSVVSKYFAGRMVRRNIEKVRFYDEPYYKNAFILIDDIQ